MRKTTLGWISVTQLIALFIWLCLSGGSPGFAQGEQGSSDTDTLNLNMTVEVGMGGKIRLGCYFPVRVTLENQGEPRHGTIRIVSEDPARPLSATFLAECDVPANSRKTYFLYPYVLEQDPSPTILIQYVEGSVLLTKQVDLSYLQHEDRLWVEVADEGYDFTFLSTLSLPNGTSFSDLVKYASGHPSASSYMGRNYSSGSGGKAATPLPIPFPPLQPAMVGVHPGQLPTHSEGYEAVDGLILNSRRFYELSKEQQEALADWVLSGGKVIAWLGDDPARYQGSFITGAVDGSGWQGPSACTEAPIRTTLASLQSLAGFLAGRPVVGSFPVTYAPQETADVLLAEGSVPILQHIRVGNGDLLLSGPDLAGLKSASVHGLDTYFAFLLGYLDAADDRPSQVLESATSPYSPSGYGSGRYRGQSPAENPYAEGSIFRILYALDNVLNTDNLTAMPKLQAIILFLLIYIITIGPINYFILLKLRRREWLWYTIPLLVAAFCVLTYGWARATKGTRLLLTRLDIVDVFPGLHAGWETSAFGLYSPSSTAYNIRLEGNRNLIREMETPSSVPMYGNPGGGSTNALGSGNTEPLSLVQDGSNGECYVKGSFIHQWDEVHYRSEGGVGFDGNAWAESVTLTHGHVKGKLNYTLGFALANPALLYSSGGGYIVRQLASGTGKSIRDGSLDFDILLNTMSQDPGLGWSVDRSGLKSDQLRNVGLATVLSRKHGLSSASEIILAGWREGSNDRALKSPLTRMPVEETLVLIHIPFIIDSGDTPTDAAMGAIIGIDAGKTELDDSGSLLLTAGRLTYAVTLPPVTDSTLPQTLKVTVRGGGTAKPAVSVYAFDYKSGTWTPLREGGGHEGDMVVMAGDFRRYVGPDNRTMLVLVETDPNIKEPVSISGVTVDAS